MIIKKSVFVLAVVGLAACASAAIPADKLANSEASVKSAEELGAAKNPNAALHLRLAQEQLAKGKQLMKAGDNKRAEYVISRSEADAEVAMSLAREAAAKMEAQQTFENVQKAKSAAAAGQGGQ